MEDFFFIARPGLFWGLVTGGVVVGGGGGGLSWKGRGDTRALPGGYAREQRIPPQRWLTFGSHIHCGRLDPVYSMVVLSVRVSDRGFQVDIWFASIHTLGTRCIREHEHHGHALLVHGRTGCGNPSVSVRCPFCGARGGSWAALCCKPRIGPASTSWPQTAIWGGNVFRPSADSLLVTPAPQSGPSSVPSCGGALRRLNRYPETRPKTARNRARKPTRKWAPVS